jgi:hypothetical protein
MRSRTAVSKVDVQPPRDGGGGGEDAMAESRDARDPRDELRAMNKQARSEFEAEQQGDTGGGEHVTRAEREYARSTPEGPSAKRPRER